MFNIKKGNISLDITYTAGKVQVKQAPDNLSYLAVNSDILVNSYEALASGYLKLHRSEDPAAVLMAYFKSIGYLVYDLPPRKLRNELGEFITVYRL